MDRDGLDLSSRSVAQGTRGQEARRRRCRVVSGRVAAVMLVVGMVCSVLGAAAWRSYVHTQASRTFTSMATMAADTVSSSLQRDDDLGQTARTLVETTPALTNEKFATWFRLLGAGDPYPGSFGLMYIENVRKARLAGFSHQVMSDPPLGVPVGAAHDFPAEIQPSVLLDARSGGPARREQRDLAQLSHGAIRVHCAGPRLLRATYRRRAAVVGEHG